MTDTNITTQVVCPCGCGEPVRLTLTGFSGTTAEVGACSGRQAEGIHSFTVRKSAALAFERAY